MGSKLLQANLAIVWQVDNYVLVLPPTLSVSPSSSPSSCLPLLLSPTSVSPLLFPLLLPLSSLYLILLPPCLPVSVSPLLLPILLC